MEQEIDENKKEMKAKKKEMKKQNKENKQEKKHRISKGQIAVKIVAGFAAFIMFLSVFSTGIYYIYTSFFA